MDVSNLMKNKLSVLIGLKLVVCINCTEFQEMNGVNTATCVCESME